MEPNKSPPEGRSDCCRRRSRLSRPAARSGRACGLQKKRLPSPHSGLRPRSPSSRPPKAFFATGVLLADACRRERFEPPSVPPATTDQGFSGSWSRRGQASTVRGTALACWTSGIRLASRVVPSLAWPADYLAARLCVCVHPDGEQRTPNRLGVRARSPGGFEERPLLDCELCQLPELVVGAVLAGDRTEQHIVPRIERLRHLRGQRISPVRRRCSPMTSVADPFFPSSL